VELTQKYWIADSECTQGLWKAVMGVNPAYHQPEQIATEDLDLPVEQVSYDDVLAFLVALNVEQTLLAARLPSESEWEYAARAGTETPFSLETVSTDTINCQVYVLDPYISTGDDRGKTVPVKSLPANAWGLHEVHGNVWEWCVDVQLDDWGTDPLTDPVNQEDGPNRVVRGGSWQVDGIFCRSAHRAGGPPITAVSSAGFRLAAPGQPNGDG